MNKRLPGTLLIIFVCKNGTCICKQAFICDIDVVDNTRNIEVVFVNGAPDFALLNLSLRPVRKPRFRIAFPASITGGVIAKGRYRRQLRCQLGSVDL